MLEIGIDIGGISRSTAIYFSVTPSRWIGCKKPGNNKYS